MKSAFPIAAALAGACALLASTAVTAATGDDSLVPLERIVAVVNDNVILASELEQQTLLIRQRMERAGEQPPPPDALRERLLDEMILEQVQLQYARRIGIEIDDEAINDALRKMASDRGTDLAGLRERMAGQGLPFARLREQVRTQLTLTRLRQRVIASQVTISEQEIDDFLAQRDQGRNQDVAYDVRHILLRLPEDAPGQEIAEARRRAERIISELRGGAEFSALAARESDGPEALSGGELGWREAAELPGLFVDALESMAPGDISEPLRSANGFHVLELVDRRGGAAQTITEYHARHILLRDTGDSDRPRRELSELRRRIQDGASFAQLARRRSDDENSAPRGGDLGWFGPGEMTPAFQEVVETLKPGQISEPFRTPYGWHIVEVLGERERTDVERYRRAQARQTLYRRRVSEETRRWLHERREEAYIDRRLDEQ